MDDFDRFWSVYPKKRSKGDARKAWRQTEAIRPPIDEVLAAVDRGNRSVEWHKADREGNVGAFIPYPASWLRAEGWDDEYTVRLPAIRINGATAAQEPKLEIAAPSAEQVEKVRDMLRTSLRRVA